MNRFKQIAGYEKEKQYLMGLREMLLNLDEYRKAGVRIPCGILLYGEPGVGKSMLARAIADKPIACVEVCSADCTREDAADRIMSAFETARSSAPSVLLIDEIDKIAESSMNFYMDDNERIMKILLQELDGQKDNSGVLVVATCNQYRGLNPALLRSGRFDRMLLIDTPSLDDRKAIIRYYMSKIKLKKRVDVSYFAKITAGFTGAQLECFINEAGILAMKNGGTEMTQEHLRTAMNNVVFRSMEGDPGSDRRRRVVAVHEAGHALVAYALSPDRLSGASVLPHGDTLGHVCLNGRENDEVGSVQESEDRVTVGLAGAAAEKMVFRTHSASSADDYVAAASVVQNLITINAAYGLELLCPSARGPFREAGQLSERLREKIDSKRVEVLERLNARAETILSENRDTFSALADALFERYSLSGEEIAAICHPMDAGRLSA